MKKEKIAIIGIGMIVPKALDKEQFWQNVKEGRNCISEVPPDHWDSSLYYSPDRKAKDKTYTKIGGFIEGFKFNSIKYRIPPVTGRQISRLQQMVLEATSMALDDAGYSKKTFSSARTAVVFGNAMGPTVKDKTDLRVYRFKTADLLHETPTFSSLPKSQQENILKEYENQIDNEVFQITEDTLPGELSNVIAGRVASVFNFNGPNMTIDAACASSLAALDYAVSGLREGKFDVAVTGGADDMVQPAAFVRFSKLGALSADGSYAFDERANGFVMAEAVSVYILKRLSDAEKDGDKIYALINAVGCSSDGKGKGITAPNPKGQKMAIEHAFSQVEYNPGEVDFVEAHGTATRVGDASEVQVLKEVFGPYLSNGKKIGLTSVKSQIGHSKAAAGAVSVAKTALAISNKVLPASINCEKENPAIDLNMFYVIKKTQEWKKENGIRRADVSAFGFGGTNFHVLMEEYTGKNHPHFTGKEDSCGNACYEPAVVIEDPCNPYEKLQSEAITINGNSPLEVVNAAKKEAREIFSRFPEKYPLACYAQPSMMHARGKFGVSIVAKNAKDFCDKVALLEKKVNLDKWEAPLTQFRLKQIYPFTAKNNSAKVGLLFPGQGSQSVNMLRDLAAKYRVVKETFDEADEIMLRMIGIKLTEAIWSKPGEDKEALQKREDAIRQTKLTQPAMMTADIAMYRLIREYGIKPDMAIGHSLGEYAAATAAGVFTFENGLRAVTDRAKEMSGIKVKDPGKMAFVALGCDRVDAELAKLNSGYVISANKNCPTQTVIAGEGKAVDAAVAHFKSLGVEAGEIAVSHAFHSAIIEPATVPYRAFLQKIPINLPSLPILSNVTSDFYPDDKQGIYDLLVKQMYSPVEFIRQLEHMYELGVRTFIECGPKRVLTGFASSTLKDKPDVTVLASNHPKRGGIIEFNDMLANMTALGIHVDWNGKEPISGEKHFTSYFRNWALANVSAGFAAGGRETTGTESEENDTGKSGTPSDGEKTVSAERLKELLDTVSKLQEQIKNLMPAPADKNSAISKNSAVGTTVEAVAENRNKTAPDTIHSENSSSGNGAKQDIPGIVTENKADSSKEGNAETETPQKNSTDEPHTEKNQVLLTEEEITEKILNLFIEKTGYTKELLNLDSDMEADLGIDTIKQAEILSELRDTYKIKADDQVSIKDYPTIRHCIRYVFSRQASAVSSTEVQSDTSVEDKGGKNSTKTTYTESTDKTEQKTEIKETKQAERLLTEEEITEQIISLFVEKTGYSKEMLDLDSDMEADLGIDTIKQAEILAQLRENYRIPADGTGAIKDYPTIRHCIKFVTEKQRGARAHRASGHKTGEKSGDKSESDSEPAAAVSQNTECNTPDFSGNITDNSMQQDTLPADTEHKKTEDKPDDSGMKNKDNGNSQAGKSVITKKDEEKHDEPLFKLIQDKEKQERTARLIQENPELKPVENTHAKRHIRYVPLLIPAPVEQESFFKLAYKKPVIVFAEDMETAKAFRAELDKRMLPSYIFTTVKTKIKNSIQYNSGSPEDMEITFRAFASEHKEIQGIIFLNGCMHKTLSQETAASKDMLHYAYPLFLAAKVFKPALCNVQKGIKSFLSVITTADGGFGCESKESLDPVYGAMHGMALCLRKELPSTVIKIIDFDPSMSNHSIAHKTMSEILYGDARISVALRDNRRFAVIANPELLDRKNPYPLKGKKILITGGGRGLGSIFTRMLAEQHGAIPLILDRISLYGANASLASLPETERERWKKETLYSELQARFPERKITPVELEREYRTRIDSAELQKNLNLLSRICPEARYYQCDLLDMNSFNDVFSQILSEHGRLDGIVHFAGIEMSRRIEDKSHLEFSRVFATKAASAVTMWKRGVLKQDGFMLLISSVIGRFGNLGQCDYAAASAYISCFARALAAKGIKALAVDMSAYDGTGMSTRDSVKKYLDECGVEFLHPEEGMQAVLDELVYGNRPEILLTAALGEIDADHQLFCNTQFNGNGSGELSLLPYIPEYIKGHTLTSLKNFSVSSDPYLEDHKINGKPYVPGNIGMETFAEAVSKMRGIKPDHLSDISFRYPIKLFRNRPEVEVILRAIETPEGICRMSMRTEFNAVSNIRPKTTIHFEAAYSGEKPHSRWTSMEKPEIPARKESRADRAVIYDSFFQGPRFRVLERILSCDEKQVMALASMPKIQLWDEKKELIFRPLVFESMFQTCAWRDLSFENMIYLPDHIDTAMIIPQTGVPEQFYVYGRLTEKTADRHTIYNAWAFDREYNLIAELSGYGMIPAEEL